MSRKNTKGTILAIDMGNTNIVIGCVDDDKVIFEERLSTDLSKTELEYAISIKTVLEIYGIDKKELAGAILSSAVPPLTGVMRRALGGVFWGRERAVPAARARQSVPSGHCSHRGAPLGRQTSAPSSIRA